MLKFLKSNKGLVYIILGNIVGALLTGGFWQQSLQGRQGHFRTADFRLCDDGGMPGESGAVVPCVCIGEGPARGTERSPRFSCSDFDCREQGEGDAQNSSRRVEGFEYSTGDLRSGLHLSIGLYR